MAYLGIPQNTIAVLQKYHFNFQKKFGQNFLIDTTVLDRIISSAEIEKRGKEVTVVQLQDRILAKQKEVV